MAATRYKPIQVYLRPDQLDTLRYLAKRRDVSIAHLVQESVDRLLADAPADEDPLLEIIGLVDGGPSDASERHDHYLAQAYADNHHRDPKSS